MRHISIPVDLRGFRRYLSLMVTESGQPLFGFLFVSSNPLAETKRPICFCVPANILDLLIEELDTLPVEEGKAADLHQEPYNGLTHLWSFLDQI